MDAKKNKLAEYLKNSKTELKKVAWPTKKELTNHTLTVIGISLGVAFFLGLADYLLSLVMEKIILG